MTQNNVVQWLHIDPMGFPTGGISDAHARTICDAVGADYDALTRRARLLCSESDVSVALGDGKSCIRAYAVRPARPHGEWEPASLADRFCGLTGAR